MRIAPLRTEPGLIAYECPACGKVTSEICQRGEPLTSPMPRKLRPTGLGSGIDKDRPDYTVCCGGWGGPVCADSGRCPSLPDEALRIDWARAQFQMS